MRNNNFSARRLGLLALLAAIQLAMLLHRQQAGLAASGRWLVAGDDVAGLRLQDASGKSLGLPLGQPTALLVFDPACAHSAVAGPTWAEWTRSAGGHVRVLAVSAGGADAAVAFAEDQGWEAPVLTVRSGAADRLGDALTRRTPWVFVLDERGVIVSEGHGSRVGELAAPLERGPRESR
jgi:hypothetical protein